MVLSAVAMTKLMVPDESVFAVPEDVLTGIADFSDDESLGALMSSCKSLRWSLMVMDDFWLSRVVNMMGRYAGLAYLEQGEDEQVATLPCCRLS